MRRLLEFLAKRWYVDAQLNSKEVVVVSEGSGGKAEGDGEVSELIQALKEAVMELRETVTELTNPLNRLGSDVAREESPAKRKVEVIPLSKGGEKRQTDEATVARPATLPSSEVLSGARELGGASTTVTLSNKEGRLRRLLRLMRMLCSLRGRVPPTLIERYINVFVKLGLIGEDEGEIAKDVLKALEEGYAKGLGVEDQVVLLALIARGLGINDEILEDEAFRVVAESFGNIGRPQRKTGNGPRAEELAGMKEAG